MAFRTVLSMICRRERLHQSQPSPAWVDRAVNGPESAQVLKEGEAPIGADRGVFIVLISGESTF